MDIKNYTLLNAVLLVLLYQYRVGAYRQKNWGRVPLRARFAGGKATTNKKLNKYFLVNSNQYILSLVEVLNRSYHLVLIYLLLLDCHLLRSLCGLRQSFRPSGTLHENVNVIALYVWNIYKLYCNTNI